MEKLSDKLKAEFPTDEETISQIDYKPNDLAKQISDKELTELAELLRRYA